jgi:uncharacterized protein (TIGR00251 family)
MGRSFTIDVKVTPRASRDEIVGMRDGVLAVRVTAPPVDDKANRAVVKLLAKRAGVARGRVSIVRGERAAARWSRSRRRARGPVAAYGVTPPLAALRAAELEPVSASVSAPAPALPDAGRVRALVAIGVLVLLRDDRLARLAQCRRRGTSPLSFRTRSRPIRSRTMSLSWR